MQPLHGRGAGAVKPSIPARQVARDVFGRRHSNPVDWFYRNRARLEAEHGFPRPIPGLRELWYDPEAIEAWLAARRDAAGTGLTQRTAVPDADALEADRDDLRARLPGLADRIEGAE